MDIGNRIKQRRELLGISQEELAGKVGYKSRSSINKIESDGRGLPQSKIMTFANALDTTPAFLMGWESVKNEESIGSADIMKEEKLMTVNSYENLVVSEMEKMNQRGKVRLLDTAREMTCNPLYNGNYKIEVNAAHARTDIAFPEGVDTSENDIMDDENF